jgi:hypothetical protein
LNPSMPADRQEPMSGAAMFKPRFEKTGKTGTRPRWRRAPTHLRTRQQGDSCHCNRIDPG